MIETLEFKCGKTCIQFPQYYILLPLWNISQICVGLLYILKDNNMDCSTSANGGITCSASTSCIRRIWKFATFLDLNKGNLTKIIPKKGMYILSKCAFTASMQFAILGFICQIVIFIPQSAGTSIWRHLY